jgi:phosphate transport system protein
MPGQKMLDELNELHREFLDLGTCVGEVVTESVRAIREPDSTQFAPTAVGDDVLADLSRRIVERCRRIVLLYQPMAGDFREVTAILRMAGELESVGHLATEIVERSAALTALPIPVPEELDRLAEEVSVMIRRVLDASTLFDEAPVRPAARISPEVISLARILMEWVAGTMRADPAAVEPGLSLFAVVQNLQRIAEHASALAEEIAFLTEVPGARFGTDHPVAAQ